MALESITKLENDMGIISKLDDEPNDVAGMTAAELKAKFDEGGETLKQYLNGVLIPGIEALLKKLDEDKAGRDELQGVVLGQVPDKSITEEKISGGAVSTSKIADEAVTKKKLSSDVQNSIDSKAEQAALELHVADKNNPHQVQAAQVPISEALAGQMGLSAPAFVEGAVAAMHDNLKSIFDSVSGTPSSARWKMFKWAAIGTSANITVQGESSFTLGFTIRTSNSIAISNDGTVSLVNPVDAGSVSTLPAAGTYFQIYKNAVWQPTVYRVLESSTSKTTSYVNTDGTWAYDELAWNGLEKQVPYEEYIGMIGADAPDAYPEDGWVDGVHYVKEVRLDTKIAQIKAGSYVGNGKYGAGNPTVFEFSFAPKIFIVFDSTGQVLRPAYLSYGSAAWEYHVDPFNTSYFDIYVYNGSYQRYSLKAKKSEDGRTISFYAEYSQYDSNYEDWVTGNASVYQANTLNETYYYVGIG